MLDSVDRPRLVLLAVFGGVAVAAALALVGASGDDQESAPRTVATQGSVSSPDQSSASVTVESATDPDTLVRTPLGLSFGPDLRLDPRDVPSKNVAVVLLDIFEPIVTLTADGDLDGGAARTATLSDDGLSWTFELRDDLVWSDGEPVTAADYALRHQTPFGREMPEISRVVVLDDHALRFDAADPYAISLARLANIVGLPLPAHAAPDLETPWSEWDNPPSNGAYTLTGIDADGHIYLEKNELYAGAADVAFGRVVHQNLDWPSAAFAYTSGQIDLITQVPEDQSGFLQDGFTFVDSNIESIYYYVLNTEQPELSDQRVRRALFTAIDREELVRWVLDANGTATSSLVPATLRTWRDEDLPLSIDERGEESRRLMTAAGYSAAEPLTITISGHQSEINEHIGQFVAQGWQEIYVEVEFDYSQSDLSAWFDSVGAGEYQIATMTRTPPQTPATFLDPCFQPTSDPYCGFRGGESEALKLTDALGADETVQQDRWRDLDAQLAADAPLIPLFHYTNQMLPGTHIGLVAEADRNYYPTSSNFFSAVGS